MISADAAPGLPRRAGIGLKPQHYADILRAGPQGLSVGWFEAHPENYMGAGGPPHRWLTAIREHWPLSLHAVGLSLGSAEGVDPAHLTRLKALVDRYQPQMVSDHLAWSQVDGLYLNDLLPVPLTATARDVFADNIDRVQAALKRRILIENPSVYLRWTGAEMTETDLLADLVRRTGCGLLLDVNNVAVSCGNLGADPVAYLRDFPMQAVEEIHLAGHAVRVVEGQMIRLDDHGSPVSPDVWDLFALTLRWMRDRGLPPPPTLIEWDTDVPSLSRWQEEAVQANHLLSSVWQQEGTDDR
ncbi:MNIO family bufferin maturase [Novispirillum itersonii]|uniref:Uncharacterized protein n=1 Tax=Novispirillum itersonii TaxID=189 RepID=A0A7W9ZG54_NOVIT|nr:DUF692 domain-containing protein [Novispirillum itersonii]MBB6210892.1 hypothetical protein [Novispirillum itersonii]